ncbi:TolC family protein [Sulfurovum sp. XTW-4]|uniref:TolC family protein n=1 Tax=Sulfurovum xiamenensis TaxID=3019066 RepID=A0ABT7QRF7_9BACT|nr:TolC family protein [Sulfurovum xiamenensis]MDM5263656.1 TolC family protein [Sulfurovum xiamenensis]
MKKTLLRYAVGMCIFSHEAFSQEIFTVDHMKHYLTEENPYIYTAVGQQYIDAARIQSAEGGFDTKLSVAYDQKEYPISTGEFSDISFSKPTENGTEFIVGYRRAEGIQEYNNIKTGSEGELRVGVKVPVFSLLNDMNERKYTLEAAKINATRSAFESQNNLRNLYTHIVTSYYQLLYYSEVLKLEKKLLHKATKRNRFIEKRVSSGDLADVAILESKQQIINREQRVLTTKNNYSQALQLFLNYLNLSKKEFELRYVLPSLKMLKSEKILFQNAITQALTHRPDIKVLDSQRTKLDLDTTYNSVSAYPKLNLFAYGVHDIQYGEGIKVGLQFDIPLERRSYKGKMIEIQKGMSQIEEEKHRLLLELKTNLSNLIYSLDIINQNIELGEKETKIVETLEEAENKKYEVGSSDLFQINQREIRTLEVKKKQLEYYLNALVIQQEIKKEMGESMTL